MNFVANQNKKELYIRCKKCRDEVYWNTHKKMTPCKCGAVEVDGCEDCVRVIGNEENYIQIQK